MRRTKNQPVTHPKTPGGTTGGAKAASVLAAWLLAGALGPCAAQALEPMHVGESYLHTPLHAGAQNSTADAHEPAAEAGLSPGELLDPGSRLWAGGQGLLLTRGLAERLLAENVIAGTGDSHAAAAARADGSLEILGPYACTSARTPGGQPALALALAVRGGILAAWAQGANDIIFYELGTAGCAATMSAAPFQGEADIALSPGGELLAAHDNSGALWLGPRGDELRPVARMPAPLALLSFSESGGTLVAVGASGKGGVWNARSGVMLRSLDIAGGPFRSGVLRDGDSWLRRHDGTTGRWDLLHDAAAGEAPREPQRDRDWVEQRGSGLYLVSMRPKWRAEPLYEPIRPVLDWSRRTNAVRLRDADGAVRYYDAQTGKPSLQVFAEDWANVPIDAQGLAVVQDRSLRIFDSLEGRRANRPTDSRINCRAVSEDSVLLWTDAPKGGEIRVGRPEMPAAGPLQNVAEKPLALPYRRGLLDAPAQRSLLIN